uniref:Uncharacterized protein n=1 Tax=Panagrolaimus superbus TaxID=310955 RepID=A0A914YM32_9BILA
MHALAEHGRAAGDAGCDEFGHGDGQIARKGCMDDETGAGGGGHFGGGVRRTPDLPDQRVPTACTVRSAPLEIEIQARAIRFTVPRPASTSRGTEAPEYGVAGIGKQQLVARQHPAVGREEAVRAAGRHVGTVTAEPRHVLQLDGAGAAVLLAQCPATEQIAVA